MLEDINAMVENKNCFIWKWQERVETENPPMKDFGTELYFALAGKMTVYDGGKVMVSLLEGTEVACEVE